MPTQTFLFQVNTSQGIISSQAVVQDGVEFDFDSSGLDGGTLLPVGVTGAPGTNNASEFDHILLPTHTSAVTTASPSTPVAGGLIRSLVLQAVGADIHISTNANTTFPVTAGPVTGVGDKVIILAGSTLLYQAAFVDTTGTYAQFGYNPFPTEDVTSLFLWSPGGSATLKIRAILKNP
jgi:hypothetical protein